MTDTEKIEKLAKWLGEGMPEDYNPRLMLGTDGNYYVDAIVCAYSKDAEPEYRYRKWNPFTNIADAWMLVKKSWEKAIEAAARRPIDPILVKDGADGMQFIQSIAHYDPSHKKLPTWKDLKRVSERPPEETLVFKLSFILASSVSWRSNNVAQILSEAILEVIV